MVKNKRDLKAPHRRSLLNRTGIRKLGLSTNANIKVVIRVRPPNEKEQGENIRNVVKVLSDQMLIFDPEEVSEPFFYHGVQQRRDVLKKPNKNMQFSFDRVFGFDARNDEVFVDTTKQLINTLMDGYNCSVFVYGATGAGKTHTMLGSSDQPGITFLTMKALFEQREALSLEKDFELGVTYLEVYNEIVQDLLNPGAILHLREDGKYGVIVAGIQMKRIESSEELFALLEQGNGNRTQHPTDANAESSRSHAVFQVYLKMTIKLTGQVQIAKLSMIDLAGSERGAATGCIGQRFTEGANINKSLLALGNCINSLADGRSHVPYRDSKLTRLLKDSLGGNCQTVMIANISPSSTTYEDTYNTLKYAMRAKKIKSCVRKNVVNKNLNVDEYLKLIEELKAENERLNVQLKEAESAILRGTEISKIKDAEIAKLKEAESAKSEEADSKPLEVIESSVNLINTETKERLLDLFAERRKISERFHQIDTEKQSLDLKRKMKESADARLSDLCTNTPEKAKGHKRLGSTIIRIFKQSNTLQGELYNLRLKGQALEIQTAEILETEPGLQSFAELEEAKLKQLDAQHKAEVQQRLFERLSAEYKSKDQLFEKMSNTLRSCYLQLKGRNFLPDSLEKDYRSIVQDFQGIRTVTWNEPIVDVSAVVAEEENRKRKNDFESSCSLDGTFTLGSRPRPPLAVCAEQLLAKGSKPPKKLQKLSPRKENRPPARKPTAAMGTAQRFHTTKSANLLRLPHRPVPPKK